MNTFEFLLDRFGWRTTSVDQLARQAGVARATIYRRWGDIDGVAVALICRTRSTGLVEPATGRFADDAHDVARQVASRCREAPGLCSAVAAMGRDSRTIREVCQSYTIQDRRVLSRIADRAYVRGELCSPATGVHALSMIVSSVEYGLAVDPMTFSEDFLQGAVRIAVAGSSGLTNT